MNKVVFAIALLVVGSFAFGEKMAWSAFKSQYGKSYASPSEEAARFQVFQENMAKIRLLNSRNTGDDSARFAPNKFSDMTAEEFRATHLNLNRQALHDWKNTLDQIDATADASETVDWRDASKTPRNLKAVSSIKDQEQCGSCWAFSATAALEGCKMIINADNKDVDGSPQQLVDCCHEGGSEGCNGGEEDDCLAWAVERDISTWKGYPYTAKDGKCKKVTEIAVHANECKYHGVESYNETAMQAALRLNVVSVGIDANTLQFYSSGVIKNCEGDEVDHAVLLVAHDVDANTYTVKNSWGADWGESGYFRMLAGKNCLDIASDPCMALPHDE